MAEINEYIEDFGDNFKANMKKPWFKVALGAVVIVGLYALYKNMQGGNAESETDGTGNYYIPTGYATGYPEYNGGGGYDGLYSQLDAMQGSMDNSNDALQTQIDTLVENMTVQKEWNQSMQEQIKTMETLAQMKDNSEQYNASGNQSFKDSLHEANKELGGSIGLTFDGMNWVDENNTPAYLTTDQLSSGYVPTGDYNPAKIYTSNPSSEKTSSSKSASATAEDQKALTQAGLDYNIAKAAGDTAGMEAAHAAAEAIRNKYGYSGGTDGSEYIATSTKTAATPSPKIASGSTGGTQYGYNSAGQRGQVCEDANGKTYLKTQTAKTSKNGAVVITNQFTRDYTPA